MSAEHSASIVWGDDDDDTESVDIDAGDGNRLFTYEVAKRHEQEESAVSRPGFQVLISSNRHKPISDRLKINSRHISRYEPPEDCSVDPSIFVPSLIHGETTQGFWTATYVPQRTRSSALDKSLYSRLLLKRLL